MSFLTGLVARSIEGSAGIRPRRAARFERESYLTREAVPLDTVASAPVRAAQADAPLTPQPALRTTAAPQTAPLEAPRPAPEVRTRIERIVMPTAESALPRSSRDTAASDPAIPAAPARAPAEPARPGRQRRTRAAHTEQPPAPQPPATERIGRIETVRSIEQRLVELSREVTRERLIERERAPGIRPAEAIAQAGTPHRATAAPPASMREAASARPTRLRAAQALPRQASAPEPTIEVHIGRVELRATVAPPQRPAVRRPATASGSDGGGLETYLRRRDGR